MMEEIRMFKNLVNEMRASGITNAQMAESLDMTEKEFERKMMSGKFKIQEARRMSIILNRSSDYLFA